MQKWVRESRRLSYPSLSCYRAVEPLEETRSELVFATEMLLSTLQLAIPPAGRHSAVELDEIEVRQACLQLISRSADVFELDPERHPSTMQGPLLPTHFGTSHSQ